MPGLGNRPFYGSVQFFQCNKQTNRRLKCRSVGQLYALTQGCQYTFNYFGFYVDQVTYVKFPFFGKIKGFFGSGIGYGCTKF